MINRINSELVNASEGPVDERRVKFDSGETF